MRPIKTLKEYESRYKNYKRKLFRFTKKEVEDFDKAADTIGEHYVLKHRKWVLFGDTYYEIPKPIRVTWFKGLSAAGKLGACSVLVGSAGVIGGGAYGIYALMNRNSSIVVIDSALQEYIKVNSVTKNSDGDTVVSLELIKDPGQSEADPAVYKGDHLLEEGKDYKSDFKSDTKIDLIISKEAMEKYPGKIIIKASEKPEKEITKTQFLKIIDDLNAKFVNSEDEYSIDKISQVTIGDYSDVSPKTIKYTGEVGSTRDFVMTVGESEETSFTITSDKVKDLLLSETEGGMFSVFDDFIMYQIGEGASLPTGKTYCNYLIINSYGYVTYYEESKDGSITFRKCANFQGGPEKPEPGGEGFVTDLQWRSATYYLTKENIQDRNLTVSVEISAYETTWTETYLLDDLIEEHSNTNNKYYTKSYDNCYSQYNVNNNEWSKVEQFDFDGGYSFIIEILPNIKNSFTFYKDEQVYKAASLEGGATAEVKFDTSGSQPVVSKITYSNATTKNVFTFSNYGVTEITNFPFDGTVDETTWNNAVGYLFTSSENRQYACTITNNEGGTSTLKVDNVEMEYKAESAPTIYQRENNGCIFIVSNSNIIGVAGKDAHTEQLTSNINDVYGAYDNFSLYTFDGSTHSYKYSIDGMSLEIKFKNVNDYIYVDLFKKIEDDTDTSYSFNYAKQEMETISTPNNLITSFESVDTYQKSTSNYLYAATNHNTLQSISLAENQLEENKYIRVSVREASTLTGESIVANSSKISISDYVFENQHDENIFFDNDCMYIANNFLKEKGFKSGDYLNVFIEITKYATAYSFFEFNVTKS